MKTFKTLKKETEISGSNEFKKYTELEVLLNKINVLIDPYLSDDTLSYTEIEVKKKLRKKLLEFEKEVFELRNEYQVKKLMEFKKVS